MQVQAVHEQQAQARGRAHHASLLAQHGAHVADLQARNDDAKRTHKAAVAAARAAAKEAGTTYDADAHAAPVLATIPEPPVDTTPVPVTYTATLIGGEEPVPVGTRYGTVVALPGMYRLDRVGAPATEGAECVVTADDLALAWPEVQG